MQKLTSKLAWRALYCGAFVVPLVCAGCDSDDAASRANVEAGGAAGPESEVDPPGAGGSGSTAGSGVTPVDTGLVCTGCLIGGRCYAEGDHDPDNPCATCSAGLNAAGWSDVPSGVACDDALICTVDDHCEAGRCVGRARDCDDDRACTTGERCEEPGACVAGTSSCAEGQSCLSSGECGVCQLEQCNIAGTCFDRLQLNPNNPCEACDSPASTTGWSPLADGTACDDGLACTSGDACSAGACRGQAQSCDDGVFCNGAESCAESNGTCATVGGTSPCETACFEADRSCAPECGRPREGCACSGMPPRICQQAAGKGRLVCDAGVWVVDAACGSDESCARATGECDRVVRECIGRAAGARFCAGGALFACGPDGVETDVQGLETCDVACTGDPGNAVCVPTDDFVEIGDVFPPGNVRGGALLIVGRNLDRVTDVWFDGVTSPVLSLDDSVANAQKIIAQVPEVAANIGAKLRLVTPDGLSESIDVLIQQGNLQGVAPGPLEPYRTHALTPKPEDPPTYPPISNFWSNDCDANDVYFLAEEDGSGSGGIRSFTQADSGDPAIGQGAISGFLDMETLLFHMTVTNGDTSTRYVGIYSVDDDSEANDPAIFRLVLFPEDSAGRQLVLSVTAEGSQAPSSLDPAECSQ